MCLHTPIQYIDIHLRKLLFSRLTMWLENTKRRNTEKGGNVFFSSILYYCCDPPLPHRSMSLNDSPSSSKRMMPVLHPRSQSYSGRATCSLFLTVLRRLSSSEGHPRVRRLARMRAGGTSPSSTWQTEGAARRGTARRSSDAPHGVCGGGKLRYILYTLIGLHASLVVKSEEPGSVYDKNTVRKRGEAVLRVG